MMKKEHLIKISLIIISLIMLFLIWFAFVKFDEKLVVIDELRDENKRNKDLIERLEGSKNTQVESSVVTTEDSEVREVVNVFLQSVYTIKEDNYDQRREDAEVVLSGELFEMIFGDGESKIEYSYHPSDISIYTSIDSESSASSFITFEKRITDLDNGTKNTSFVTLEIKMKKQGDHWIIHDFKEIHEEPL